MWIAARRTSNLGTNGLAHAPAVGVRLDAGRRSSRAVCVKRALEWTHVPWT